MIVYKLGDKYLAARSNEFGFANYEVVPQPAQLHPVGLPEDAGLHPLGPSPKPSN